MMKLVLELVLDVLGIFAKATDKWEARRAAIVKEMEAYQQEARTSAEIRRKEQEARKRLKERNRGS